MAANKEERITKQFIVDHLDEGEADLSLCYLTTVPVKELASVNRFKKLDLSQNKLTELPESFVSLKFVTTIDLSKNQLTHLPDNFGELSQLLRLDLFGNALSTLPLSFCQLTKLKWLDVRANQLEPALVKVAGDCCNEKECRECAINIVRYMEGEKVEQAKIDKIKADKKRARDRKKEKKRQISQAELKKQKEEDKIRKRQVWSEKQALEEIQKNTQDKDRRTGNPTNNSMITNEGSFESKLIHLLLVILVILIGSFVSIMIVFWEDVHPYTILLYDITKKYLPIQS